MSKLTMRGPAMRAATCSYDFPSWSPDRSDRVLAFIAADPQGGVATLWVARAGKLTPVGAVKGVANTARARSAKSG